MLLIIKKHTTFCKDEIILQKISKENSDEEN